MNASVLFHIDNKSTEFHHLNLDKMILHGGYIENLAKTIINSEEYAFMAPLAWLEEFRCIKNHEYYVGLPAMIHLQKEVYFES